MLNSQTLTTASPTGAVIDWPGGGGVFDVYGTFGGGSVGLNWRLNAADTFRAIGSGVSVSANGQQSFSAMKGQLQPVLSGSTDATVLVNTGGVSGPAAAN